MKLNDLEKWSLKTKPKRLVAYFHIDIVKLGLFWPNIQPKICRRRARTRRYRTQFTTVTRRWLSPQSHQVSDNKGKSLQLSKSDFSADSHGCRSNLDNTSKNEGFGFRALGLDIGQAPKRVLALPEMEQSNSVVINTLTSKSG